MELMNEAQAQPAQTSAPVPHYHVAYGVAVYAPDGADGYASFEDLAGALEYASDYLQESADAAYELADVYADEGRFEEAWTELRLSRALELQRMNQDIERRRNAPLYKDDDEAYAALLEDLAGAYPVDVDSRSCRLYLWGCDEAGCEHWEDDA